MTTPEITKHVAIIGAGVGGLILALALQRAHIPVSLFDARAEDEPTGLKTTVILTPNAVRVLDELGVYQRCLPRCVLADSYSVYDVTYTLRDTMSIGDVARFGYSSMRIYRFALVEELRAALSERAGDVHFQWHARFSRVLRDDGDGVEFELADGSVHSAGMLVGADGIHSAVRSHISPAQAKYTGTLLVLGNCPLPAAPPAENPDVPASAGFLCKPGMLIALGQHDRDTNELLLCRQLPNFANPGGGEGWRALSADKQQLLDLLRGEKQGAEWPPYVRDLLYSTRLESAALWPFYLLPDLERWYSPSTNVILIGDAAHAIPPSAGQGAAQAAEDAVALARLLAAVRDKGVDRSSALEFFQAVRRKRIGNVRDVSRANDIRRLPAAQREEILKHEKLPEYNADSMDWLYGYKITDEVLGWIHEKETA